MSCLESQTKGGRGRTATDGGCGAQRFLTGENVNDRVQSVLLPPGLRVQFFMECGATDKVQGLPVCAWGWGRGFRARRGRRCLRTHGMDVTLKRSPVLNGICVCLCCRSTVRTSTTAPARVRNAKTCPGGCRISSSFALEPVQSAQLLSIMSMIIPEPGGVSVFLARKTHSNLDCLRRSLRPRRCCTTVCPGF